jgi:hypothetical protein
VLDIGGVTQNMLSTTKDPANAARAISWGTATDDALPAVKVGDDVAIARCSLSYPVAPKLPDGLLFAPSAMEEKWALFHRGGSVIAVRSWTAQVGAVARGAVAGDRLVIDQLTTVPGSLGPFGDPVAVFDWLVRSHALGQQLPLPVAEDEIDDVAMAPLALFSAFGRMAIWAATSWAPPAPERPLRVHGAVLQAVRRADLAEVQALLARGADPDVPSPIEGYTALHVAMVKADAVAVRALLGAGASARARTDRGMDPIGIGIVHGAPPALLEELVAAGGDLGGVNVDDFGLVHAAAETNRPEIVDWLVAHRLGLETRTKRGFTPLHIACGLGHADAARALVAAGADTAAPSPSGTPREIAEAGNHAAIVDLLGSRSGR